MVIGIDGNEANIEKRVGVNMYAFDLLWSIWKLHKEWIKKHRLIVYLKNKPLDDMPPEVDGYKYQVIPGGGLWILTKLMPRLMCGNEERPAVFFSPSHYVPLLAPMPKVCSIMDLGYLEFSGQFKKRDYWQLRLWSAISILLSKAVISISQSTKRDIVRHYPHSSKKIFVTYPAYDKEKYNSEISQEEVRRVRHKYTIVGDYILFLSTLKPSKNVEGLLNAFGKVRNAFPEIKLIIAGKKGWLFDSIFEKVKKLGLEKEVVFTGYVDEKDKPALIRGAKIFVLPSYWEGFGLDVLNAMACGIPVVVSNTGSLPEVVGDAGILIDPYKTESIKNAIIKLLSADLVEYNKYVKAGMAQANKFSWEKTARETIKIIESVEK
ncbi:MAG: glycosyltransferase family 1 protein [bacterium]|nr:glycosyltransferase family 1 protein [bacterium]